MRLTANVIFVYDHRMPSFQSPRPWQNLPHVLLAWHLRIHDAPGASSDSHGPFTNDFNFPVFNVQCPLFHVTVPLFSCSYCTTVYTCKMFPVQCSCALYLFQCPSLNVHAPCPCPMPWLHGSVTVLYVNCPISSQLRVLYPVLVLGQAMLSLFLFHVYRSYASSFLTFFPSLLFLMCPHYGNIVVRLLLGLPISFACIDLPKP